MPRGRLARLGWFGGTRRSLRRQGWRGGGSAQTRTHDVQKRISTIRGDRAARPPNGDMLPSVMMLDHKHWTCQAISGAMVVLALLQTVIGASAQTRPTEADDVLLWNIINDDARALEARLNAGMPLDYQVVKGETLLQAAVLSDASKCIDLLIARGAQLDILSAAGLGKLERVRELLAADAGCANRTTPGGHAPLHLAAANGRGPVVSLLVEHGAKLDVATDSGMPIHVAVAGNHLEVVRLLVRLGSSLEWKDTMGWTPIDYAGSTEMLRLLIELGGDAAQKANGVSLLESAAYAAAPDRVRLLLEHRLPQSQLNAALHACASAEDRPGSEEVAKLLLDGGARLDATGTHGGTVLHTAVLHGSLRMCKFFLDRGVDVNGRDKKGQTALHYAAWCAQEPIARLLTAHGANWNVKDDAGLTPTDYLERK